METVAKTKVTVEAIVNAPVERVWALWTDPKHILHWNFASIDWHTTYAESDFRVGGKFFSRMESKDAKSGFDFTGEFKAIELYKFIEYTMSDGRRVRVNFDPKGLGTRVSEIFEAELANPVSLQQEGWQAILDNFKLYVESPFTNEILTFETEIDSDVEKVYAIMTGEKTYTEWTSVFNPDSRFRGSWKKGSKIVFLGSEKDGSESGMVSKIKENIPNKFISIEHMGVIRNGREVVCGPDVDDWQGALENYTFRPRGNKTLVVVDLDSIKQFQPYFTQTWPKALLKLKEICERQ